MPDQPFAAFIITARTPLSVFTIGVATAADALRILDEMVEDSREAIVQGRAGKILARSELGRLAHYERDDKQGGS